LDRTGFTLTELLVAISILALIVLTVSAMLSSAQQSISLSRKLLDCDDQARLAFARMQNDFTKIVKRTDVDFISAKQVGNDKIFFYTQAVGDTSNVTTFPYGAENPVSLVGYTVTSDPNIQTNIPIDLQRLGRGLNWLASNTLPATDNMVFLTPATSAQNSTSPYPYFDPNSTLDGHWSTAGGATYNSIGAAPTYAPTTSVDPDYHVIGDEIFRLEFCYLLKDGSYSDYPVEANSANVPTGSVPLIVLARPPKMTDDSSNANSAGIVATGTRWFDSNAGRAYLCTNPSKGAAVWQGLGVQDVSAIVVAIALMDRNSRKILNAANGTTAELATLFGDSNLAPVGSGVTIANAYTSNTANSVVLMQQSWRATINGPGFISSLGSATGVSSGLAQQLASHINTYQRYFYLNTATSL
jgi:prepilin-type N-terminal cleavage/methylation domain-containing protein